MVRGGDMVRGGWRAVLAGGCAAGALLATGAHAQSATIFSGTVNARLGAATNPYQLTGNDTNSAFGAISIAPELVLRSERGSVRLAGAYERTEYFRRYSGSSDYTVSAAASQQINPTLEVHSVASYSSAIIGSSNLPRLFPLDPTGAPPTGTLPNGTVPLGGDPLVVDPLLIDPTLAGLRQRSRSLTANGGFGWQPNERDRWTLDGNAGQTRYPGLNSGNDSIYYGGAVGYSRQLNERTSVGVRGSVTRVNYRGNVGDSTIYDPRVTLSTQFGPRWAVSGSLGASISRQQGVFGPQTTTSLSGDLSACRRGELDSFCLTAARASSATGFGGVRTVTSAAVNYSRKLAERLTLDASANYSRSSGDARRLFPAVDYATATVSVSKRLNQRLSLTVTGGYTDVFQTGIARRADLRSQIGLNFAFGDIR